ncbi:zinc finger BED domain-containing protein RICESLEEPER 2-like [Senna tora]|uniref:Zinc finger BED domain-containing protein RICESLEEPER 2-like n=1 Tax=Senna tora TaxID=362788 RepID=A0A835C9N3_9FABA|nr:zinc finger BED domain-containing protein RICESLEEPER 2-like [Senna tora]
MCAEAIIEHDLPYSFVHYKGIRKWIKFLNPDVIMPSRNTAVSDIKKIYEKEKEKLKQEMARIPNRVCLTSNVWTACTSEEGLKVASDALHKIRESVKYVKANDGRMQKFDDCVRESGGVETGLGFMQVWKIECMLNASLTNEDEVIRDMAHRMKVKFDKYWSEYNEVLAFGAILDPHSKLEFLQFCYSEIDSLTSEVKVQNVRMKLYKLYKQYEKRDEESSSTPQSQLGFVGSLKSTAGSENPIKSDNRFKKFKNDTSSSAGKSELDQYLDEAALDSDFYKDLEVLQYWKDVQKRFPHLSIMARDVLSIPITTVAFESAFSIGARVLTKYRSSILPEKMMKTLLRRI